MILPLPKKIPKSKKSDDNRKEKPKKTKRKRSLSKSKGKTKEQKKAISKKTKTKATKKITQKPQMNNEVIELLDESDDDEPGLQTTNRKPTETPADGQVLSSDEDSEFEFEG